MDSSRVSIVLQTADRTRKAQVTVPRSMQVSEVIKASRGKWRLSFGADYQVVNLTTNRQLSPHDLLTVDKVNSGDILMLQPLPTHGA